MIELKIKIELMSPILLGSGEGLGSLIDTDIIYDNHGLPYLPARRLKGLLRESASEVKEMLNLSGIEFLSGMQVDDVFGKKGGEGAPVVFRNLYVEDYEITVNWLKWAFNEYGSIVSKETVLDTFTEIRRQTAVSLQNGVAENSSLRTIRVLKVGYILTGNVIAKTYNDVCDLLALACANLKHVGSNRSRGLGEVKCSLWDNRTNLTQNILEELKGAVCRVQP